jgi:tetratricopeptide (TPR) repeat protein
MGQKLMPAVLCMLMIFTGCKPGEEKVSKEEAVRFSSSLEKDVKDLKINFIEKNIITPVFLKRLYDARKLKPSADIEMGTKKMLAKNQYEKSIYDMMAGKGSFSLIKQYEKAGLQHSIFRINGDNGLSYIDMELTSFKNQTGIADIFLFSSGENLSASMAELVEKIKSHQGSAVEDMITQRLGNINRYLKNRDYEMAKKEFDQLPYNIRNTRLYEGRYLEILSNMDEQQYVNQLNKMEIKYGDEPSFQLMMIDAHINQKAWDKAMGAINKLDSFINKDPFLDYHRGLVMNLKGDTREAVVYFENTTKHFPDIPGPYADLVMLLAKHGEMQKARQNFALYKKFKTASRDVIEYLNTSYPGLKD